MPDAQQLSQVVRNLEDINLVAIVAVAAAAWLAIVLIERLVPWLAARAPARYRLYILPWAPSLRLLILAGAGLRITLLVVEPTTQNIVALVAAAGLALGFAFKDYASSLIAGLVALYERPYRTGDWIAIGGDYGEVKSMGLRSLQMVTPDDTTVTIPHSTLWTANVHNANHGLRQHLCVADFYVHPAHDAEAVRRKLWDVGVTSAYTSHAHPVTVIVHEQPWGTHYRLKAYPVDGRSEFQFTSDLTVRGKLALAQMGVPPAAPAPAVAAAQRDWRA